MRNLAVLYAVCVFAHAHAQGSADAANKTNNPLNPAPSFNIQSYYSPRLSDSNAHTADFLLRPTLPLAPGKWIGVPQIVRGTLPISIRPTLDGSYQSGIGDISLFDIFLLRSRGVQIGAGPLLTIPTATDRSLGTGKWQAGAAAVVVDAKQARLLGMLLQWQHSFADKAAGPMFRHLPRSPLLFSTCRKAGICDRPACGHSTCSTAITMYRLDSAPARHGRTARPFSTRLSSPNIPCCTRDRGFRSGRFLQD
jgi:hypothetical protein